jgi:hypothetical protein
VGIGKAGLVNGRELASARLRRTASAIYQSLGQRADTPSDATALLVLP